MAEWILDNAFECPHGFVQDYNDCKYQHHEECTECERWKRILAEKVYLKYLLNEYGVDCLWISVKDRLPEKPRTYLVYVPPCYINVMFYNGYEWVVDVGEYCFSAYEITHWMPLPEPPKEG